jgi:hypothetical protein
VHSREFGRKKSAGSPGSSAGKTAWQSWQFSSKDRRAVQRVRPEKIGWKSWEFSRKDFRSVLAVKQADQLAVQRVVPETIGWQSREFIRKDCSAVQGVQPKRPPGSPERKQPASRRLRKEKGLNDMIGAKK